MYLRYLNVFECFSLKISAQRIWEVTNVQKNGSSVCNESRLTLKEREKKKRNEGRDVRRSEVFIIFFFLEKS